MAALVQNTRSRPIRWIVALVLAISACSSNPPDLEIGDGANSRATTEASSPVDGLAVGLNGEADGDAICPWSTQPCVTLDQDVGAGPMSVTVSFVDGVASVVNAEPIEEAFLSNIADRCNGTLPEADFNTIAELPSEEQEAAEAEGTYAYDTLGQYILTIPDSYALRWLSNTQRVHLGVVGDAAPHEEALEELGLREVVCVAGGFATTEAELEQVQLEVGSMLEAWAPLNESASWSSDVFQGAVVVGMYEVDSSMLAESEERFGELVILEGAFTVLNGSLDELHEKLALHEQLDSAEGDANPPPTLSATCGSVEFPTIPPKVNAFPPLDEAAQKIFDDFLSGPLAVEAEFISGADMRIAERTDTTLELFGIDGDGYVNASFEKRGDVWSARGWGGCNISVSAVGFGSASTVLDPDIEPDPTSTTLHIQIQELECASGQAPVDREVLPVVVETDAQVQITTLVAPVVGGANCQGNPWFPVVVELDEPLGDRTVVDMQDSSGIELGWPPDLDR